MASVKASPRRKSDKIWRDAIIRALARRKKTGGVDAGLDELADTVVAMAAGGDASLIKEIGDRIDGKPIQSTAVTDSEGNDIPVGVDVRIISRPG